MAGLAVVLALVVVGVVSVVAYKGREKEIERIKAILSEKDPKVKKLLKIVEDFEVNYSSLRVMGATMPYRFDLECFSIEEFKKRAFWTVKDAVEWIKENGFDIEGYESDKKAYKKSAGKARFCRCDFDEATRDMGSYHTEIDVGEVKYGLNVDEVCRSLLIETSWRWTWVYPLPINVQFDLYYVPREGKPLREVKSFQVVDILKEVGIDV